MVYLPTANTRARCKVDYTKILLTFSSLSAGSAIFLFKVCPYVSVVLHLTKCLWRKLVRSKVLVVKPTKSLVLQGNRCLRLSRGLVFGRNVGQQLALCGHPACFSNVVEKPASWKLRMDIGESAVRQRVDTGMDSSSASGTSRNLSAEQLTLLPDAELLDCVKNCGPSANANAAADVLFTRYRRLVLSVAFKILRDPVEAEDVTQDILIEVWRKARLFDAARGSAKMWILQYAYTRSLNRRKYLTLHQSNGHNGNGNGNGNGHAKTSEWEPSTTPDMCSKLTLEERQVRIINALGALSDKQKKAIELIYFEGFSLKEVAEKMDESIGNTRHFYYRGVKRLRLALAELAAKNGK